MTSMWWSMVVGLTFALALQAQGQIVDDSVRASVFQVIVDSNDLNREHDFEGALALLEALDLSGLTPAELVLVRRMLANTYQMDGQFERARKHYWMVIDEPANHTPDELNTIWYRLAYASYRLEDYEDVLRIVGMWRDRVAQPGPDIHRILALTQMRLGNPAAALAEGDLYVAAMRAVGDTIPSSFATFLAQAREEASDFRNE